MFCPHCGKEIPNSAALHEATSGDYNGVAIVGFVLSFFSFLIIVSLPLCAIGLSKARELGGKNHGFAVAGMTLSIMSFISGIVLIILLFSLPVLK